MRGGEKIDFTWSVCQTHTSVHVAHQFIMYHTSIVPNAYIATVYTYAHY